jgi:hypothetical protein
MTKNEGELASSQKSGAFIDPPVVIFNLFHHPFFGIEI